MALNCLGFEFKLFTKDTNIRAIPGMSNGVVLVRHPPTGWVDVKRGYTRRLLNEFSVSKARLVGLSMKSKLVEPYDRSIEQLELYYLDIGPDNKITSSKNPSPIRPSKQNIEFANLGFLVHDRQTANQWRRLMLYKQRHPDLYRQYLELIPDLESRMDRAERRLNKASLFQAQD